MTLTEKSKLSIKKDKVDYIVTSSDENRQDKIILMNLHEKFEIFKEEDSPVEEKLVRILMSLHNIHINKWEYST
jgi:hypothetical protein